MGTTTSIHDIDGPGIHTISHLKYQNHTDETADREERLNLMHLNDA